MSGLTAVSQKISRVTVSRDLIRRVDSADKPRLEHSSETFISPVYAGYLRKIVDYLEHSTNVYSYIFSFSNIPTSF